MKASYISIVTQKHNLAQECRGMIKIQKNTVFIIPINGKCLYSRGLNSLSSAIGGNQHLVLFQKSILKNTRSWQSLSSVGSLCTILSHAQVHQSCSWIPVRECCAPTVSTVKCNIYREGRSTFGPLTEYSIQCELAFRAGR